MNLNHTRMLKRRCGLKPWGITRKIAALLFVFTLIVPAHAGPVVINQVIQTLSPAQGSIDLRIRNISDTGLSSSSQDPKGPSGQKGSDDSDGSSKGGTILSGAAVSTDVPSVDVLEEAVVEGSVCDCGEIIIPGGAFPKWPFLFLAAVPLVFIHGGDDTPKSTPTPTPIPTPTPTPPPPPPSSTPPSEVPEPASILLFGSGLLALGTGLRRRYLTTNKTKEEGSKGGD